MKFIWEISDVKDEAIGGLLVTKDNKEIFVVGGSGGLEIKGANELISLQDGYCFEFESPEDLLDSLNRNKYKPIFTPVNAGKVVKGLDVKLF